MKRLLITLVLLASSTSSFASSSAKDEKAERAHLEKWALELAPAYASDPDYDSWHVGGYKKNADKSITVIVAATEHIPDQALDCAFTVTFKDVIGRYDSVHTQASVLKIGCTE